MLTLATGGSRDCSGLSRRNFLRAGTLALGGLSLPWLLRTRALASGDADFIKDKSVVLVFLAGGASHIETFNPNMDAPEPYHSVTGEVKTTLPGVTLGGTFPMLARHAHKMAIVRSFHHPVGSHPQAISHVLTGGTDTKGQGQEGFSIGSVYARLRGTNHPATGFPTYVLLTNPHQDGQYKKELPRVVLGSRPGPLGTTYGPFTRAVENTHEENQDSAKPKKDTPARSANPAEENMTLHLPPDRLEDRRALLHQLGELQRGLDARDTRPGFDQFEQQAVDLLMSGAGRAFDLSGEDRKTVERYDTSMFKTGKKVFEQSALGKQMLMARRLVESGAGFVTVQSAGWDMHADGNNPGIEAGMEMLGRPLDKALSAFLEDLEHRGLSEKVLVIVTGDFGRTPKINGKGGRDHWANLCTLALWGGGLKMGQVIGKSDRSNGKPASNPYDAGSLLSTVMHALFDVGVMRVARGIPGNLLKLIEDHPPISELF
jgi:uncharacterized protein (DUF1501 family)